MVADGAVVVPGEVEVGMVGHVAQRGLGRRRLVADDEVAHIVPAVGHGDVQLAGEAGGVIAALIHAVEAHAVSEGGFGGLGVPQLVGHVQAAGMQRVDAVIVQLQLIGHAVDGEAPLADAVAEGAAEEAKRDIPPLVRDEVQKQMSSRKIEIEVDKQSVKKAQKAIDDLLLPLKRFFK